jgi:hypothetical protein
MKFILALIIVFCTNISVAQETTYYSSYNDLKSGSKAHIFGTQIKLRSESNTSSEVVITLDIGTPITILSKTTDTLTYNGILSHWYKIETASNTGFVLRSFISIYSKKIGSKTLLINPIRKGKDDYAEVKIVNSGQLQNSHVYLLSNPDFTVIVSGNKGLTELQNIICLSYIGEACGINDGDLYLFYDGTSLVKALETNSYGDGGIYWISEELTFPEDKEGSSLSDEVLFVTEEGETADEDTEWVQTKGSSRKHKWMNGEWVPAIR